MTDTAWVKRGARVQWGPPDKPSVTGDRGVVVSVSKGLALVRLDSGAELYVLADRLRRETPDG